MRIIFNGKEMANDKTLAGALSKAESTKLCTRPDLALLCLTPALR